MVDVKQADAAVEALKERRKNLAAWLEDDQTSVAIHRAEAERLTLQIERTTRDIEAIDVALERLNLP